MAALKLFRFRSEEDYYMGGDLVERNWFKLADKIQLYSMLSLFGVATIT